MPGYCPTASLSTGRPSARSARPRRRSPTRSGAPSSTRSPTTSASMTTASTNWAGSNGRPQDSGPPAQPVPPSRTSGRHRMESPMVGRTIRHGSCRLEPCGMPPPYVLRQIRYTSPPAEHRYFKITAIDADHVRRSGVARVDGGIEIVGGVDQTVQFVWLTSEQLNWRTRPPRRTAELPHDRAQGWYIDPTREHELRWYSAGTPTELVKDGAIES